jgi:hypothetical protein
MDARSGEALSAQIAFMGIHATVGWCPPVVVLRRMGVRTKMEIERERRALEAFGT